MTLFTQLVRTNIIDIAFIQVLRKLSANMASEVVRHAPGTFEDKMILFPSPLKCLVALSVCPNFAASCHMASPASFGNPEVALFSICVEIKHGPTDAAQSSIMHDASGYRERPEENMSPCMEDVSGDRVWLWGRRFSAADLQEERARALMLSDTHDPDPESRFSVRRKVGSVGCIASCSRTLEDLTITLPKSVCIVFSPSSGHVRLKGVTFQGSHNHQLVCDCLPCITPC